MYSEVELNCSFPEPPRRNEVDSREIGQIAARLVRELRTTDTEDAQILNILKSSEPFSKYSGLHEDWLRDFEDE